MIMLVAIAVILFLLAFITKRRFGVLGLALCAGSLLATALTADLAGLMTSQNISLQPLSDMTLASILLIMLPSLLLLFAGPKYVSRRGVIIGSLGYALLAILLLLGPLSQSLSFDTAARDMLQQVARYESTLIAIAVVFAVIDMWFTHIPRLGKSKKH